MEKLKIKEYISLTKTYRFSAGHRLFIKNLSDEENFEIFDTCSSPNGHGHDYYIQVKVAGDIDPATGMIISLEKLDEVLDPIIDELDHKRLDIELPYFEDEQATGENIAKYIWDRIEPALGNKLIHIKLSETSNSYFEYYKEDNYPYEL
ncbi:MAG: 6-carboxytetrahydropterin synthase [Nitrosopumilaceae archaeon]|nr:6-carboxytetrahydropterin synthase [Nitrosopumilaceae archaeon]